MKVNLKEGVGEGGRGHLAEFANLDTDRTLTMNQVDHVKYKVQTPTKEVAGDFMLNAQTITKEVAVTSG